ncbi:MAG: phosphopantetheine-binding protein [Chlamydiota bacterium]|nr:phosphopantetheine-binding protein [Chlamydiota bacterium]
MAQADKEERRKEIFERLKNVLITLLKIMREKKNENRPNIEWKTDLIDELGVDSLESIDLMNAIEEEFQVSPSLNEANSKRTVEQIVDYILELEDQKSMKS